MQRFQFPLETVLRWRTTQLELENAKLATLQQEKHRAEQLCITLREACCEEVSWFQDDAANVTGMDLALLAKYKLAVAQRLKRLKVLIASCDVRIGIQTSVVVAKNREKRLLESLKERQYEEWNCELSRETENAAGELFLARQHRSSRR